MYCVLKIVLSKVQLGLIFIFFHPSKKNRYFFFTLLYFWFMRFHLCLIYLFNRFSMYDLYVCTANKLMVNPLLSIVFPSTAFWTRFDNLNIFILSVPLKTTQSIRYNKLFLICNYSARLVKIDNTYSAWKKKKTYII